MLKTRVLTGVVLGTAMGVAVLYLPTTWISVLFALLTLAATWEWTRLAGIVQPALRRIALIAMALILWTLNPVAGIAVLGVAAIWWIFALIAVVAVTVPLRLDRWNGPVVLAAGVLTLAPAWLALVMLHLRDPKLTLFLLALVWVADTAAFLVGRRFGRSPLAPRVSPKKTREGLWGALAGSALFALPSGGWLELGAASWVYFVGLSLLAVLFSVVGDLFESLLKRNAGVKDSGSILPGHGGILDRIDSLTAAAPVFVLGLHWL